MYTECLPEPSMVKLSGEKMRVKGIKKELRIGWRVVLMGNDGVG